MINPPTTKENSTGISTSAAVVAAAAALRATTAVVSRRSSNSSANNNTGTCSTNVFPKQYLDGDGFKPTEKDIWCCKGKKFYDHAGNEAFRQTIFRMLPSYMKAQSKLEKSAIVNQILHMFRSTGCRFIRQDTDGRHYEIGDDAAREKIGQTIRESLIRQDPERQAKKRQRRALNKAKRNAAAKSMLVQFDSKQATTMAHNQQQSLSGNTHVVLKTDPKTGHAQEIILQHPSHHHVSLLAQSGILPMMSLGPLATTTTPAATTTAASAIPYLFAPVVPPPGKTTTSCPSETKLKDQTIDQKDAALALLGIANGGTSKGAE